MRLSAKYFTEKSLEVLQGQVLRRPHEYYLWKPDGPITLKEFQEEVASKSLALMKSKDVVSAEVFCAGGKTITSAFVSEPFLRDGKKVVFISPKRDAFPHFENDFKRVLSTLGMDVDMVHARNGTGGVSAFPVDKQVLIVSPYDVVSPRASLGERRVIDEALKRAGLVIIDEVHRIPKDPDNETVIIGKVEPIVRRKAMAHGAKVLTMTGTHFRMDDKPPFGVEEPDIRKTCQDLVLAGCLPNLYGFPVPIEIDIRKGEVSRQADVIQINLARKRLSKYMGKVADVILKVVEMEGQFAKSVGAKSPGGHAIFVGRQEEARVICAILNERLGREAFKAYVSDEVTPSERQDVLERLRDGRLLGYATVMLGVESLNVPRLKYCHLVARVTSGNKLMQALGRVMRLPEDEDCKKVKDKAVVIDYQVRKKRIIRLAMGLRDIAAIGGSRIKPEDMLVGGPVFEPRKDGVRIKSIILGEEEAWLRRTGEEPTVEEKKVWLLNLSPGSLRPKPDVRIPWIGSKRGMTWNPGQFVLNRTSKSSESYDPNFEMELHKTHPGWFRDRAEENKRELLAMPIGSRRPTQRGHPLGTALTNYTVKNSGSYDADFDKAIRHGYPQWFVSSSDETKRLLLSIKRGDRKPKFGTRLGDAINHYCCPTSNYYDASLSRKLRRKQPQWFIKRAEDKKATLLAMACGSQKPRKRDGGRRGQLGLALHRYCNPKSGTYDAKFFKAIMNKQPQWFINSAEENKKALLSMPIGAKKPIGGKHPLGEALCSYTRRRYGRRKGSYDSFFEKAIRKKHPEWFIDTAAERKRRLLDMPKGCPRPRQSMSLGWCLCNYIYKNAGCYDPAFDKAIRAKHPEWFKKKRRV